MLFFLEPLRGDTVTQQDIIGVLFVYFYVAFLLLITEKIIAQRYNILSRKLLHILVGNIAFILPIFQTREIMAFLAAGPFILFTYLISSFSPIQSLKSDASEAGHKLGLVYYALAWTVLAYVFFDYKVIIAIGILAMSYGDGLASLIGSHYGKRTYQIYQDVKSYIGSVAMFVFTFLLLIVAMLFYGYSLEGYMVASLLGIAGISALIEGITPFGLDNLSVPLITAVLSWRILNP